MPYLWALAVLLLASAVSLLLIEKAKLRQQIERPRRLIEIVPHVRGQPVARQQGMRMAMKKQEKIEIARVPEDPDAGQQVLKSRTFGH